MEAPNGSEDGVPGGGCSRCSRAHGHGIESVVPEEWEAFFTAQPRHVPSPLFLLRPPARARSRRCCPGPRDTLGQTRGLNGHGFSGRSIHVPGPLRRSRARAASQREFGPDFARALFQLKPGSWQGPIESSYDWHLIWIDAITPGRVPGNSKRSSRMSSPRRLADQKAESWRKAYRAVRARYRGSAVFRRHRGAL